MLLERWSLGLLRLSAATPGSGSVLWRDQTVATAVAAAQLRLDLQTHSSAAQKATADPFDDILKGIDFGDQTCRIKTFWIPRASPAPRGA